MDILYIHDDTYLHMHTFLQLENSKKQQEDEIRKLQAKIATPPQVHVTEGATDYQEEAQVGVI